MAERNILKNFNNFRGRDIRASDLVRDADYAIDFENALVVKEDSCVKRQGFKIRGAKAQYEGLYTYRYADPETGQTIEELISLSENLHRKYAGTFVVSYSGSSTSASLTFRLDTDTGTFKLTLTEDGDTVLTADVGTGLEDDFVTMDELAFQISSVANFHASIGDEPIGEPWNLPAAFLPITITANLASLPNSVTLDIEEWEVMSRDGANIRDNFSTYHSNRGADEWEFASVVNMNNVLYLATGYEYLHKYDGQNVYRAGLPFADPRAGAAVVSGPGITDSNFRYIYLYKQVDNRGNIVYGVDSDPTDNISTTDQKVELTLKNIELHSGFNTNCALVDGTQTGVLTIVVDECNTMKVGDTAYFYDDLSAQYVERLVTERTNTSITVEGPAVNVTGGAVISCNLRIVIYRSTAGGNLFYKVVEIPNNCFTPNTAYTDSLATANLGIQYVPPTKLRDLLEIKPRYLCIHQDLLIAAGASNAANNWYFSNGEGPEYFDAEINFEQIKSSFGGGIKGLGSDQEHLILGTERSLFVVTGDIDAGSSRQERISERNIGFASHNSIADIGGRIIFLTSIGFWAIQGGFNLEEVGASINPEFINILGFAEEQKPRLKRAMAVFYEDTNEYICHVPTESGTGVNKYVNENTVTHTFDTFHGAWGKWPGLNLGGGIAVYNNNIYFQDKRADALLGATGNLWERQKTGYVDDYADHHLPIPFKLGTQWMDGGEPSVFKVFLWFKVYNLYRSVLPAPFVLTVAVERDYNKGVTWSQFELAMGGVQSALGWGFPPWGSTEWGAPQAKTAKKKLRSGKAESIRYVITNNALHEKAVVSAWETVVTSPYSTELKD